MRMAIFTTLRSEILRMQVDSVGVIAILSMSYITRCIVKT